MTVEKYFDWSRAAVLDPRRDGCSYEEWAVNFEAFPFAVHPKGFLVFLSPAEVDALDEYRECDPYKVQTVLKSNFTQRRIQCTLELIRSVVADKGEQVRMLDLGCGQGHITARIKEAFPMAELSGLDCSISAISYAVEAFDDMDFIVGSALRPPYSKGYFDIVICNNLWEHVASPSQLLESIRQITRVGGYLVISTPSRYRIGNLIRVLCGKPVGFMSTSHVMEYSVGQVIEQLKFGQFDVIRVFSRPLRDESFAVRLIMSIGRCFIKMTGSHHSLETTVFFLARNRQ